jgi:hypothetical protein
MRDVDILRQLAEDELKRKQRLAEGDDTPDDFKKTEKPTCFADQAIKLAAKWLDGRAPPPANQLRFTLELARLDPAMLFHTARMLGNRLSGAPSRTGPEQEMGRRISTAVEVAQRVLREKGEPGVMLNEIERFLDLKD